MLVRAWNTDTGEQHPTLIPQEWLDRKVFPNLVGSQAAATRAQNEAAATPKTTTKKES